MSEATIQRIFEKLDELQNEIHANKDQLTSLINSNKDEIKDEIHNVDKRLIKVEESQESHFELNAQEHNNMAGIIDSVDKRLEDVEENTGDHQSELDKTKGAQSVRGNIWGAVIQLLSGGLLVAIGGWLAKAIGIF